MTLFRRSGTLNRSRRPSRDWRPETDAIEAAVSDEEVA